MELPAVGQTKSREILLNRIGAFLYLLWLGDFTCYGWVIFVWPMGFYLALFAYHRWPHLASSGRCVGVLPAPGLIALFVDDWAAISISYALSEFFYSAKR